MFKICQYLRRNLSLKNLRKFASITGGSTGQSRVEPNAGLIIIGDEILKAQVQDTNSFFICSLLWKCGVKVEKIIVIGDNTDVIAKEIREFSRIYRYVITSGGIGPTHDDVTFEGLAKAFADFLHYHPALVNVISSIYKLESLNSPAFKMAYIPKQANLIYGRDEKTREPFKFPCVNVENVYVFPGSPIYLEKIFQGLCKELFKGDRQFVKAELYLDATEESFADALSAVAKEFPHVTFGSYPVSNENYHRARVTIESVNEDDTLRAHEKFSSLIPQAISKYDKYPHRDSHKKFLSFMKSNQCDMSQKALEKLTELYAKPNEVAICFNGSIESTVILHLAHIAQRQSHNPYKINLITFKHEDWFPEVDEFLKEITSKYNVNMITLYMSPEEAMKRLERLHPDIKILLLGIKSKDTDSAIYHSLARSTDVSSLVIRCPLNGWSVDRLWTFARVLSIPYCSLYHKRYMSSRSRTKPNLDLITEDDNT